MDPRARRPRPARIGAICLVLVLVLTGCSPTPATSPAESGPAVASATTLPAFGHVWVVVLENKGYDQIVGASKAPYLNELIDRYGLAEAYSAVGRPSQPNYLALFSGSTHGVEDDKIHDIDAPTLADQIEAAGRTWGAYAENLPPGCYTDAKADGGRDGAGEYARKHMPALSFTSITSHPERCAHVGDFTAFEPGATAFAFLAPNLCHDMHDCSIAEGDAWLRTFLPHILQSEAFGTDGVLFITFDEGEPNQEGPDRVPMIVASPFTPPGFRSDVPHDHYSLLRTIEDAWGMPCLEEACRSGAMVEFLPRH